MKLRDRIEKRNAIAKQMRSLHEEIGDKKWTEDQESRWNNMNKELGEHDQAIEREQRLLSLDEDELDTLDPEQRKGGDDATVEQRTSNAFENLLRHGFNGLNSEERQLLKEVRAQSVGTDSKGGFTVPTTFRNKVHDSMKAFGGLAQIATIINTDSGNPIAWPVSDGTSEMGVMIAENAESGKEDVSFGSKTMGAKKMTSKIILVSNELLTDSGVDMNAYLSRRIGQRIGRGEANQLINGDGTGNNISGLLAQAQTGKTAAGTAAVTWEEFLALKHSVDPAYRAGSSHWLFNDTTLLAIKTMKDGQGRPLWLPSVAGDTPATFDADPYQIDQGMPDMGAAASPVAYGDFSSVQIRRVKAMAIKRLLEKYAEFDQVGFLAFHRFDMVLEDLAAVKLLKNAAA